MKVPGVGGARGGALPVIVPGEGRGAGGRGAAWASALASLAGAGAPGGVCASDVVVGGLAENSHLKVALTKTPPLHIIFC